LQSKSYLKILGILYFIEDTNVSISTNIVGRVLYLSHIFNNIVIASKSYIIKAFLKLDITIIWIDIWDAQSGSKAKGLINRCFNIGSHITTIQGTNINPKVLQYKNCWKWRYIKFFYHVHKLKYIKCNGLHKVEHHCDLVWCCKVNFKMNLP